MVVLNSGTLVFFAVLAVGCFVAGYIKGRKN